MARHGAILGDPLQVAAALGGRELAAILGAALAARRQRIPVVIDGEPVAVRQGRHLGLTFHPEMTGDDRIHRYFLEQLGAARGESAA